MVLSRLLYNRCDCSITDKYFLKTHFVKCTNDSLAVLNTSVIGTPAVNSSQLVAIIRSWSINKPSIVVNGLTLQIESVCNIVNGNENCFFPSTIVTVPSPSIVYKDSSTVSIAVYGGAGAGAMIIVGLVVIAAILCCIRKCLSKKYTLIIIIIFIIIIELTCSARLKAMDKSENKIIVMDKM